MVTEKFKENMANSLPTMQQLLEAGVHFGHQVRRGHPRMRDYIFGVREGVHIINLEESEKLLKEAASYANKLGKEGKVLLIVGTKKQAQPIVKELAEKINAPYVVTRWIGGTLTNFEEVRKNIKKLKDLKDKKEKGELDRTKKEQLLISRKLTKFDLDWGGVANMDTLPDVLFVIDCVNDSTAVAEANRMKIPVIAIADTNSNPALVDFPIPGNDDATKSIKIISEAIVDSYAEGLKKTESTKAEENKETKVEKTNPDKIGAKETATKDKEAEEEIDPEVAAVEEAVEKEVVEESARVV